MPEAEPLTYKPEIIDRRALISIQDVEFSLGHLSGVVFEKEFGGESYARWKILVDPEGKKRIFVSELRGVDQNVFLEYLDAIGDIGYKDRIFDRIWSDCDRRGWSPSEAIERSEDGGISFHRQPLLVAHMSNKEWVNNSQYELVK